MRTFAPLDEKASEFELERIRSLGRQGNGLRPRDIESLLQQAGAMLDTASAERQELDQIFGSIRNHQRGQADLRIQHSSLESMKARLDKEIVLSRQVLEHAEEATRRAADVVKAQEAHLADLNTVRAQMVDTAGMQAGVSSLPPYFEDRKVQGNPGGSDKVPYPYESKYYGKQVHQDLLKLSAEYLQDKDIELRIGQMAATTESYRSASAQLLSQQMAARIAVAAAEAEHAHMETRLAVSEAILCALDQDLAAGGYVAQMLKRRREIEARFTQTMSHAQARIEAACIGLRALYAPVMDLPAGPTLEDSLDSRIRWIREINSQLFSLSRNAQSIVLTARLVPQRAGEFVALIELPNRLRSHFVGTRGISLSGSGSQEAGTPAISAVVSPPEWPFDSARPSVDIGRVLPWPSNWLPEVFGTTSLHNWTASGAWTVTSSSNLSDGFLHVHAVVLRKPSDG